MNTFEKKIAFCGDVYWVNPETGAEYARVAAGVQFPGKKPGFAVSWVRRRSATRPA